MAKFRYLLAAAFVCLSLATIWAFAQSSLTQIRDTITNPDGTPFNGMVVITWNGFSVPTGTPVSQLSASARIYNGALSVLLVPTTTATGGTYYQVVYSSSDGTVTWTETWQVPPSATGLTISQVRQSTTQGTGGGPTTGTGGGQFATLPIAISQVTNLGGNLAAINTSLSTLTTQVAALSGLGATGTNANFVDAETPAGAIDGSNKSFTLANAPSPAASLTLYRNGLVQAAGANYTLAGATLTFVTASTPISTDILEAFYRLAGTGGTSNFVDASIPSGTINGTNLVFTLASAPIPLASLRLYKNGLLLSQGGDYIVSGTTITFAGAAATAQVGDSLLAAYRN